MANLPTAKRKAPVYFKALPSLLLLTIGFCANAQIPNFSSVTNLLEVPYVLIDGAPFNAKLNRETDGRFSIQSYAPTASIPNAQNVAKFTSTTGNLTLPLVTVDGQAYSGSAHLDVDNRLTVTGVGVSPLGGGLYGLQSGAEVRASLAYPQTGSTASFAQAGPQGIYADGRRTVIIDASNYMVGYELYTSSYDFGTVIADGNTWTLGPGGTYVSGGFYGANAGSGTFSPKGSLAGNTKGIGFLRFDLPYDSANALAVSLPSLSGVWTASFGSKGTLSVSINPDGSFSGQVVSSSSFVICTVSGTVSQKEPGSFKNMFSLSLSASGGLGCPLQIMTTYQGAGAILYSPVGDFVGNGYRRGLTFFAKTPGGTTLVVPFFRK